MDRPKFDTLTRTLGKRTDRRTGLLGAIGAWIGVAAAPETDAARKATRRHEKLACRNANSQCLSDDECCSGSCVPKFGGTQFRCAKRHGKKNHGARNGGGSTPIPPGPSCTVCASGCPYTTIEAAINDTPSTPTTAIITVGPGTYRPERLDPDAPAPLMIGTSMVLTACDLTQPMPTIDASAITEGESLFFLGSLDEQFDCTQTSTVIAIENLTITGGTGISAIIADCETTWALRNSIVENFSSSGAVIRHSAAQSGRLETCTIRNNTSSYDQGAIACSTSTAPYAVLELMNTLVTSNTSTSTGLRGAMIHAQSTLGVVLSGTTNIYNNVVSNSVFGGGVFVDTMLELRGSAQIVGNTGSALGGGIYQHAGSTVIGVTSSNVNGNLATTCNNYYDGNTSGCVLG